MIIEQGLSIGEAAKASGLSEDTLRYYERIGLTPFVERASSGHRRYSSDDMQWLVFVTNMRKTGMSIETLQRYADLVRRTDDGEDVRNEKRALLLAHARSVREKIKELEACLAVVDHKLVRLDTQKG
ncbi:MAG: MerR family transcriptional regulator [Candidatus Eremiobacteraeota bacterium]|nr:MerR family transcriptional regulator [Candidatus Eremiobacteraeota bacterium]